MAKAKTKTKARKSALPAGFRDISSMGGSAWKGDKPGDSITGVLSGVKTVEVKRTEKRGKKTVTVKVPTKIYTIKTKDGDVQVWESAGLKALADVKKGKPVYIEYTGSEVFTKGHNAMRVYRVATK